MGSGLMFLDAGRSPLVEAFEPEDDLCGKEGMLSPLDVLVVVFLSSGRTLSAVSRLTRSWEFRGNVCIETSEEVWAFVVEASALVDLPVLVITAGLEAAVLLVLLELALASRVSLEAIEFPE